MVWIIVALGIWACISATMLVGLLFRVNELDRQMATLLVAELQRQQVADYHNVQAGQGRAS